MTENSKKCSECGDDPLEYVEFNDDHASLYRRLFKVEVIESWKKLFQFYTDLTAKTQCGPWIFRGQENPAWGLVTAIERFSINTFDNKSEAYDNLTRIEEELMRLFKRHFHLYSQHVPDEKDNVEWLSYMQHYGTATRFLDCTYSFYVALFFALETAIGDVKEIPYRAVWAFDTQWIHEKGKEKLAHEGINGFGSGAYDRPVTNSERDNYLLFKRNGLTSVQPVNPVKLNERLILQQGVFLAPYNIQKSFIENLAVLAEGEKNPEEHLHLILIPNCKSVLKKIITELHRMNMSSATLFPGLDGFSRHLNRVIFFQERIRKII